MYPVKAIVGGIPRFECDLLDILAECKEGGALQVLEPADYHTAQQRKWYKGVCLKGLAEWKAKCNGNELLKSERVYIGDGDYCQRLTIVGVGKKNMTEYMENILSLAITMDWPVTTPDPELRRT